MARKSFDPQTIIVAGAVIVGGVVLLKVFGLLKEGADTAKRFITTAADAVDATYSSARDAVASGLFALFGPEDKSGPNLFYTVTFPDGARHAVGADRVDAQGIFTWAGYPDGTEVARRLRIIKDQAGNKFAALP